MDGLLHFWQSISLTGRCVVLLLAIMMIMTGSVMLERTLRFCGAGGQTRDFNRQMAGALRAHRLGDVIVIGRQHPRSHVARITASGLMCFLASPSCYDHEDSLAAAMRAMNRSAATMHAELNRGIARLATIASTAPLIGLFGAVVGILNAFGPYGMQRSTMLALLTGRLSDALASAAIGLLTALLAAWCYNYLTSRMENLNREMKNASSELACYLMGPGGVEIRARRLPGADERPYLLSMYNGASGWESPGDDQAPVLIAIWTFWLLLLVNVIRTASWR